MADFYMGLFLMQPEREQRNKNNKKTCVFSLEHRSFIYLGYAVRYLHQEYTQQYLKSGSQELCRDYPMYK